MDSRGNCNDIDECLLIHDCKNSKCKNNDGDYECECYEGFKKDPYDERNCIDVDECDDANLCEDKCENTHGSYYCLCLVGYRLNYDKRTCRDINECESDPCPITTNCVNSEGSYECVRKSCSTGYILNDYGDCEDIDECLQKNICHDGNCVNTNGSYRCECHEGFDLRENICEDINECEDNSHSCEQECINTHGSYKCQCSNGYRLSIDQLACEDEDECENNPCNAWEYCENTLGSYKCVPKTCEKGNKFLIKKFLIHKV